MFIDDFLKITERRSNDIKLFYSIDDALIN